MSLSLELHFICSHVRFLLLIYRLDMLFLWIKKYIWKIHITNKKNKFYHNTKYSRRL